MIPGSNKQQDYQPPKPTPPSTAWLLTFADLVSLMITFFVMLYAMKTVDLHRWNEIRGAISGALKMTEGHTVIESRDRSVERITFLAGDNLDYIQNLLRRRFDDDSLLRTAKLQRNTEDDTLSIILPSGLLFNAGDTRMLSNARPALVVVADLLRNLENPLMIVGHTDPTPIQSSAYPTNWELSMMRAMAVRDILREVGVASPIRVQGLADSRFEDIPAGQPNSLRYAQARRVEIKLSSRRDAFTEAEGR